MRKAFVVGSAIYDDKAFIDLPAAANDARNLFSIITDQAIGGAVAAHSVLIESPTRQQLRESLSAFLQSVGSDDEIVIYIAAHAVFLPSGKLSFVCRDSRPGRETNSTFSERDLSLQLKVPKNLRCILVIDSCFSGSINQPDTNLRARGDINYAPPHDQPVTVYLWAARPRELAYEGEDASLFGALLIEALKCGAGLPPSREYVSPGELIEWIRDRLRRNSKIAERFWPGIRETKAAAGLMIAKNPNYKKQPDDRATARADHQLSKLTTRLSKTQQERTDKLLQVLSQIRSGGVLPGDEPIEVIRKTPQSAWNEFSLIFCCAALGTISGVVSIFEGHTWTGTGWVVLMLLFALLLYCVGRERADDLRRNPDSEFIALTLDGFGLVSKDRSDPVVHCWNDVTIEKEFTTYNTMVERSLIVRPLTGTLSVVSLKDISNCYDESFDYIYEAFCRWSGLSSAIAPKPNNDQANRTSVPEAGRVEVAGIACTWTYEKLSALSAPRYDLSRLKDVFLKCGADIEDLPNARLDVFEPWIESFLHDARMQNALIAFSGHGVVVDGELLLCFADTDPGNFGGTAFPISRLADLIGEAQVRHVVLVLDCCFAGAGSEALGFAGESLAQLFQRDQSSITLLAAAACNQPAYAPIGQVSFFTGFFADAIERHLQNGKGLTLIQASDETASTLDALKLGQVHWRFSSQVSHRLMLLADRTEDEAISQLKAIAMKQKSSIQLERDSVWAKLPSPEKTFTLKLEKHDGVSYGLFFGCPAWTERFMPKWLSWLLLVLAVLILVYIAKELLSGLSTPLAIGSIIPLVASYLIMKNLRGKRRPASSIYVCANGVIKDNSVYPTIEIASTRVLLSRTNFGEILERKWVLVDDRGDTHVLAEDKEPWSLPLEKMCERTQFLLARGKTSSVEQVTRISSSASPQVNLEQGHPQSNMPHGVAT
jgi:uncharacterized caspase-like protein